MCRNDDSISCVENIFGIRNMKPIDVIKIMTVIHDMLGPDKLETFLGNMGGNVNDLVKYGLQFVDLNESVVYTGPEVKDNALDWILEGSDMMVKEPRFDNITNSKDCLKLVQNN